MKIETFEGVRIAYLRRTGRYGAGNRRLMEELKSRLKAKDLFRADTAILGIALDDPARTPEDQRDMTWAWSSPARQSPMVCRSAPSMTAAMPSLRSRTRKRASQISGEICKS